MGEIATIVTAFSLSIVMNGSEIHATGMKDRAYSITTVNKSLHRLVHQVRPKLQICMPAKPNCQVSSSVGPAVGTKAKFAVGVAATGTGGGPGVGGVCLRVFLSVASVVVAPHNTVRAVSVALRTMANSERLSSCRSDLFPFLGIVVVRSTVDSDFREVTNSVVLPVVGVQVEHSF